jgi:hypothetical protein
VIRRNRCSRGPAHGSKDVACHHLGALPSETARTSLRHVHPASVAMLSRRCGRTKGSDMSDAPKCPRCQNENLLRCCRADRRSSILAAALMLPGWTVCYLFEQSEALSCLISVSWAAFKALRRPISASAATSCALVISSKTFGGSAKCVFK